MYTRNMMQTNESAFALAAIRLNHNNKIFLSFAMWYTFTGINTASFENRMHLIC